MEIQNDFSRRDANSESSPRLFSHGRDSFLTKDEERTIESWILNAPDPPPCFQDIKEHFEDMFKSSHTNPDSTFVKIFVNFVLNVRLQNGPVDPGNPFKFPGYGLPLTRHTSVFGPHTPYLHGVYGGWNAPTLMNREVCMLKFVEDTTNEPEWWLKVREPDNVLQWKRQALEMPWAEYRPHADFTEAMADACLAELAKKANLFEETGMVPVMDYAAYVIKSDTLLTQTLKDELKAAVKPLESLQRAQKDWQPDTDGKVLNVVDPSLYPLVYGTSKILPDQHVPLDGCIGYCGMGEVIPQPPKPILDHHIARVLPLRMKAFGIRSQWLPCNIDLTGGKPRIVSYINNLHPVRDAPLYSIIERLIEKSLLAWDIVHRSTDKVFEVSRLQRIKAIKYRCSVPETCGYTCEPNNRPDRIYEESEDFTEESERLDREWWKATHELLLPEPILDEDRFVKLQINHVHNKDFFKRDIQAPSPRNPRAMMAMEVSQIQVIVKMANIHLTPEKPIYEGSPWQIEGQAIERICATALFYYDCDNIADTPISFRTQGDQEDLAHKSHYIVGDWLSIERVFAMKIRETRLQEIGSVLTREGRAIFYPNVYQNRLGPFELVDKTRPGHCKMLALFLVDPANPIISTANIPPQRQDWWSEMFEDLSLVRTLPPELWHQINENVDFPISKETAKKNREEMTSERSAMNK
ncbi:hypothetical protein CEP53_009311 [Fusarium sp. AF-6]|nr:hypothetical protein CEP53_009311 [Fusarium sp. AF-6]